MVLSDISDMERALSTSSPLLLPHKKLGRVIRWVIAAQTRGAPGFSEVMSLHRTLFQCTGVVCGTLFLGGRRDSMHVCS